jgi:hypothetical protein
MKWNDINCTVVANNIIYLRCYVWLQDTTSNFDVLNRNNDNST